jgi:hypothetical protein
VSGKGKEKGKEKEVDGIWEGFTFDVPGFHDEVFWEWKDTIVSSEMQILKRLGFNMQVSIRGGVRIKLMIYRWIYLIVMLSIIARFWIWYSSLMSRRLVGLF